MNTMVVNTLLKNIGYGINMNAGYFRMLVSEELRETFFWCGLIKSWNCKTKEIDSKNKPFYRLQTGLGDVLVYGPRAIYMKGEKFTSVDSIKQELKWHVV